MSAIDSSEVRALAAELGSVPARAVPLIRAVTVKGAVNIKASMRRDMSEHVHFKQLAHTIAFDTIENRDEFAAEIGPASGPGEAGNLANIAYFPNSRGGGGEVRDPIYALEDEAPAFEAALAKVIGEIL